MRAPRLPSTRLFPVNDSREEELFDEIEPLEETEPAQRPAAVRRRPWLPVVLFLLTCGSTYWTGLHMCQASKPVPGRVAADGAPVRRLDPTGTLVNAGLFSWGLMSILLAHEMGHYLQALRYRVPASPPYFLPLPFPFSPWGTLGAVIVQAGDRADRKQMFDIAVSGPLAGLVVALPITVVGVLQIETAPIVRLVGGMEFGEPLLLQWMIAWLHGPPPEGHTFVLNPWLYAGWVGLFVTSLNLFPLGQLDGGHILYTLVGRFAHKVAYAVVLIAIPIMIIGQLTVGNSLLYLPMLLLVMLMGLLHPPTADDTVRLGPVRHVVGWATLAFLIVGFIPVPVSMAEVPEPDRPPQANEQPQTSRDYPFIPPVAAIHTTISRTVTTSTTVSVRHETSSPGAVSSFRSLTRMG